MDKKLFFGITEFNWVLLFLVIAGSVLLIGFFSDYAHAEKQISVGKIVAMGPTQESNKGYALGIVLSNTCIKLIQSGSTAWPSYKDMADLWDNSNEKYSGKFVYTNGFYHRVYSTYKNSMGFYQHSSDFIVLVDPPKTAKIPLIVIECNELKEFHLKGSFKILEIKDSPLIDDKATKTIRTFSHTRFVDDECLNATVTGKDWKNVINDTIIFMKHNCDAGYTKLNTIEDKISILKTHNIATSSKYKLDKFYKDVLTNCIKQYGVCNKVDNRQVNTDSSQK